MKFEDISCGNGRYGNIREILFGNGRYGKVREIFRTGMDGTGSPGIPVPYRTVREISRTVATLENNNTFWACAGTGTDESPTHL